ncbi:MAG: hypothetical protein LBV41_06850 [Cytophagaceae bacterium]|jgi:CRISPR/Cas system CSM-associated protein Csm3 (group 7 of RAMP superfamily)|nr:hypothetical protein [Cytophagaceae bacterium]
MKGYLLSIVFLLAFTSCASKKSDETKVNIFDYKTVEKIELGFTKDNVVKNISEKHWEELLNIIERAEYDNDQYDEEKNPNGYAVALAGSDFKIKIFYKNSTIDEICAWIDADNILMNGKLYMLNEQEKLKNIIDGYK